MRVLLIRPPGHFSSLVYPDGPWVGVPLGLLYLATAARKVDGVVVRILDALATPDLEAIWREEPPVLFGWPLERTLTEAQAFEPDVIGISVAAETFQADALETIEALRRAFPEAFILAGGTDVSMQPERYLDATGLDCIAIGEGELALQGLLERLGAGAEWRDTPGLSWRDDQGEVHSNALALLDDLDSCPPAWEDIDLEPYFLLNREGFPSRQSIDYPDSDRALYLITSRGCPYHCSFCSIQITMGRRFRAHSAGFVVDQIRHLSATCGVRHVHFEDDNLSLQRDRFEQLLTGLIEADTGVTWDTPNGVRADRFDADLVQLAVRSGCIYLMVGVESGSQQVLDEIANKDLALADVERTLALCHDAGLDTLGLYIFGLPGETPDTVRQTYSYAFSLFRRFGTVPLFSIYKPYPGTPLYKLCEDNGWLIDARPYERMGKIPYMLFMPTMVETPELEIWFLVDRYQRYMLRGAVQTIAQAAWIFLFHPIVVLLLTWRLLGRLAARPASFMPTLRHFFWTVLLFPRAQVRLARRG